MNQVDFSPFFQTKYQANDFSSRLSVLISQIYETNFNIENSLQEQFGIEKKDKFITLLRDYHINPQSPATLKIFLEKLVKSISELPCLTLTLAYEPKSGHLKSFSEWFLLNIKEQILLDIKVDAAIIGGALVSFDGKFVDATVKAVFERILQDSLRPTAQTPPASPALNSTPAIAEYQRIEDVHLGR